MALGRARSTHALDPPARCRAAFLRHFPGGFRDETYLEWEQSYKVESAERWQRILNKENYRALLAEGDHADVVATALRIEQRSRHPMLYSFEKMALRDALRAPAAGQRFAESLYELLHGRGSDAQRFGAWCAMLASLPQPGKRVLTAASGASEDGRRGRRRVCTWPVATVFPFLAQPRKHLFVKPKTMRRAAAAYGFEVRYHARPDWETYADFLALAEKVKRDLADLKPRDMIDVQSFLWVVGSDEYA